MLKLSLPQVGGTLGRREGEGSNRAVGNGAREGFPGRDTVRFSVLEGLAASPLKPRGLRQKKNAGTVHPASLRPPVPPTPVLAWPDSGRHKDLRRLLLYLMPTYNCHMSEHAEVQNMSEHVTCQNS